MTRAATPEPAQAPRVAQGRPQLASRDEVLDLDLGLVRFTRATQMRDAGLDQRVVGDYAEAMLDGAEFPPGRVFYDGTTYWGARGFHRSAAAQKAGRKTFPFEVRRGTRRNAILDAVGSNVIHGLRRSDADKRRAVETLLRDPEWSKWSDHELARRAGVGKTLVRKMRRRLQPKPQGAPVLARRGEQVYELRPASQAPTEKAGPPDYYHDCLYYLMRFSPLQFARWKQLVNLRLDRSVIAEATEIVAREVAAP
jgi:hypothetical protein